MVSESELVSSLIQVLVSGLTLCIMMISVAIFFIYHIYFRRMVENFIYSNVYLRYRCWRKGGKRFQIIRNGDENAYAGCKVVWYETLISDNHKIMIWNEKFVLPFLLFTFVIMPFDAMVKSEPDYVSNSLKVTYHLEGSVFYVKTLEAISESYQV